MMMRTALLALMATGLMGQTFADKLGPAVGTSIPSIEATDQNGKTQSFASVRGPKGALVLFIRSADW